MKRILLILTLLFIIHFCIGQNPQNDSIREIKSDKYIHDFVKIALEDTSFEYKPLGRSIRSKWDAINISEKTLFEKFGKAKIKSERPYVADLIDNCWVIKGTLKKRYKGGTFLIILKADNGQIILLTHFK